MSDPCGQPGDALRRLGDDLDRMLAVADTELESGYPGERGGRQPVHTAYIPAHRFEPGSAAAWGAQALEALAAHCPDPAGFGAAMSLGPAVAAEVRPLVLAKLASEPVEDLRIDFEDGYGARGDETEDEHARAAARSLAAALGQDGAPPFCGVRVKSLERPTRRRAIRTLDLFIGAMVEAGRPPPAGFVITLPKVTSAAQVSAMALVCDRLESAHGLDGPGRARRPGQPARAGQLGSMRQSGQSGRVGQSGLTGQSGQSVRMGQPGPIRQSGPMAQPGRLMFEIQVETPQLICGPDGAATVARCVHAGAGRLTGLHYGTYDYSAALGIAAAQQSLEHPAADYAKAVMQVAAAGTGVRLSDGSTSILPVGRSDEVAAAWRLHARLVRRSLERGFYQGWDLHPAQLASRYAATYAFYRESLPAACARLREYSRRAAVGQEEPATARALATYLLRALACGASTDGEVTGLAGLDRSELRAVSRHGTTPVPSCAQ